MESTEVEPKLEAPGAGISKVELLFLNGAIKPLCFKNSGLRSAIEAVNKSSTLLLAEAKLVPPELLTKRVLVRRSFYIEDSSRFWSTAMLFRHLTKVNSAVTKAFHTGVTIKADVLPAPSTRVAAVKPELERNSDSALSEFEAVVAGMTQVAGERGEEALSQLYIPHPWMGDISHLQWLRFVAFHHRIHLTQLKRIVRGLRSKP